ncbi:MAG: hypothetical protein M3N68_13255 [Actinomycetota bacterium]|nr:hypothetical protein [Actinomycetota bacterium]
MSPVATRPRPAPPQDKGDLATILIAAATAALALLVVVPATRLPSFVDRLTVVNPHAWSVEVDATGPGGDGVVGLATVGRERAQTVEEVMDQGREWIFRFSYGGANGGELVVSRAELERAGWRVTVPAEFPARMREAKMEPSKR